MQIETYIILFGLLVGWALSAYYLFNAIKRVKRLHARDLEQYQTSLKEAKQNYLALYRQTLSFGTFLTRDDAHLLLNTAESLRIAQETWKAFPGTEPVIDKAMVQRTHIKQLADRALTTLGLAAKMTADFSSPELANERGAA